jgi:hypothetical protein
MNQYIGDWCIKEIQKLQRNVASLQYKLDICCAAPAPPTEQVETPTFSYENAPTFTAFTLGYPNSEPYPIAEATILAEGTIFTVAEVPGTYSFVRRPTPVTNYVLFYIPPDQEPPLWAAGAWFSGFPNTDSNGNTYDTIVIDGDTYNVYRTNGLLALIDGNSIAIITA